MDLSTFLGDEEGPYRMLALICAAIATGECKDKSKLKDASKLTMGMADEYLEWLDPLNADLPDMPK